MEQASVPHLGRSKRSFSAYGGHLMPKPRRFIPAADLRKADGLENGRTRQSSLRSRRDKPGGFAEGGMLIRSGIEPAQFYPSFPASCVGLSTTDARMCGRLGP